MALYAHTYTHDPALYLSQAFSDGRQEIHHVHSQVCPATLSGAITELCQQSLEHACGGHQLLKGLQQPAEGTGMPVYAFDALPGNGSSLLLA